MTAHSSFWFNRLKGRYGMLIPGKAGLTGGFTLIEMMVVLVMMGILVSIATPSWFGWLSQQQVRAAQDSVFQVMRQTQVQAKRNQRLKQLNFRQTPAGIEWAISSSNQPPSGTGWQILSTEAQIDRAGSTLFQSNGVYHIQFDARGNARGRLGRLKLRGKNNPGIQRSVMVSTLLGTIRKVER